MHELHDCSHCVSVYGCADLIICEFNGMEWKREWLRNFTVKSAHIHMFTIDICTQVRIVADLPDGNVFFLF